MKVYVVLIDEYDDASASLDRKLSVETFASKVDAERFIENSFRDAILTVEAGEYSVKMYNDDDHYASITDEDNILLLKWTLLESEVRL